MRQTKIFNNVRFSAVAINEAYAVVIKLIEAKEELSDLPAN